MANKMTAFPENIEHEDRGCKLHSRCLTCPLLQCVHDLPLNLRSGAARARAELVAKIKEKYSAGQSSAGIALELGVSRGIVTRACKGVNRV